MISKSQIFTPYLNHNLNFNNAQNYHGVKKYQI